MEMNGGMQEIENRRIPGRRTIDQFPGHSDFHDVGGILMYRVWEVAGKAKAPDMGKVETDGTDLDMACSPYYFEA